MLQDAIGSIRNNELIAALRENALLHDRRHLQRLPPASVRGRKKAVQVFEVLGLDE